MCFLFPDLLLKSISEVTEELLQRYSVTGVILDIDNTLTLPNDKSIPAEIASWLQKVQKNIPMIIVSNNYKKRVSAFAKSLSLPFISFGMKPSPFGLRRAARRMGFEPQHTAVIGDQIFTDVLGAKLAGMRSFLIEPLSDMEPRSVRLKRTLEKPVLRAYHRKKNG